MHYPEMVGEERVGCGNLYDDHFRSPVIRDTTPYLLLLCSCNLLE